MVLMVCAVALALCTPTAADAVVIDFDGLEPGDGSVATLGKSYSEDGFILETLGANFLYTLGAGHPIYSGSSSLFNNGPGDITRPSRIGGGTFTLNAIDLAELFAPATTGLPAPTVAFTGFRSDGGTVTQSFSLDGVAFDPETFRFSGFSGLLRVKLAQVSPFHQVDNIVLDISAVPLPGAMPLLRAGLGGLTLMSRHRRAA